MTRAVRGGTALVLSLTFVLGGCATIFSGTSDTVSFQSQPSGAMVLIDGVDRGRTPLTTPVKRSLRGADVTYRLEGYEARTFELGQDFNVVTLVGILCGPLLPLCGGVDLLTGAVMKYSPQTYSSELHAREDLEDALDVEEVLFDHELERDALGLPTAGQIRPNVALVNSTTKQIVILR